MRNILFFLLLILVGAPSLSLGQPPLEALRRSIDTGISVLEDPQYEDASGWKDQQRKLCEITRQIFDFKEFSRRVLGSHWKKLTSRQRKEFVKHFSEFLGKFYLRRLQSRYKEERVFYIDQKIISKSRALVEIKVLWKNLEVPVKLRMKKNRGKWKVYDIFALGISAVGNYRAQFHWVLLKKSPDEVIEVFKEKIRKLEEAG